MRKIGVFVLTSVALGCGGTRLRVEALSTPKQPTPGEVARAERIARRFARGQLGLSADELAPMRVAEPRWQTEEGRRIICLYFYDPEHIREEMIPMRGGFPHYFSVSVDVEGRSVVDHYASDR